MTLFLIPHVTCAPAGYNRPILLPVYMKNRPGFQARGFSGDQ